MIGPCKEGGLGIGPMVCGEGKKLDSIMSANDVALVEL